MTASLTVAQARKVLYDRWTSVWAARTPFCFDGEPFTPPATGQWARVKVQNVTSLQASLGAAGNRKFDRYGFVYVQIFTPMGTGYLVLDGLVSIVKDAYEAQTVGGVCLYAMEHEELPTEPRWQGIVCRIPFTYNEIK